VARPPSLTDLRDRREELLAIAARRGASNVAVVGAASLEDVTDNDAVEVLVDLAPGRSLLDLGGLLMDLRAALDCEVHVLTRSGLRPRIRERLLHEARPL